MAGINKAIILGRLGQDPETRYGTKGNAVTNFSIATSEAWKDKNTGQKQEKTEWHRCVAFGKLAEICGEYLKKGSQVYIEGKLQTRKWQGQDGQDRYTTEIVANEMQMLDSRGADNSNQTAPQPQAPHHNQASPPQPPQGGAFPDDDIPFTQLGPEALF